MKKFDQLSKDVKLRVKQILRAYSEVNVYFEDGEYSVSPDSCIKASYSEDHKFIGTYNSKEIFTDEERLCNYISEFQSYPCWHKGKRDWSGIRFLQELRSELKLADIKIVDNKIIIERIYDIEI